MNCPRPHDWELFEAGALQGARRQVLDDHLQDCTHCRAELQAIRRAAGMLREQYDAIGGEHDRLRQALMAALPAGPPPARAEQRPLAFRLLRHPAVRAAAVLALALGAWWWVRPPAEPSEPTRQQLADSMLVMQFVLGHTSETLSRIEQLACREVIGDQLSGTVRRLPVAWQALPARSSVRTGT